MKKVEDEELSQIGQTLKYIVETVKMNPEKVDFEIKYAQLKSKSTPGYEKFKAQSVQKVIVLNNWEQFSQYRVNSGVSEKQFFKIEKNCFKEKQSKPSQTQMRLDIKLGRIKISKIVKEQKLDSHYKSQVFQKQFNALFDNQEFRLDFSIQQGTYREPKKILNQNENTLVERINCLRFCDLKWFHISKYWSVKMAKIYQTQDETEIKRFIQTYKANNNKNLDIYIQKTLKTNVGKSGKYQVELKVNEGGLQHILQIHKDISKIKHFVCQMMLKYRKLSDSEQASEQNELDGLMKKLQI